VSPVAARFLQAAEREERRRAFQKRLIVVSSVLAVVLILFYAVRADHERRVAESERLRAERARQDMQDTLATFLSTVDELVEDQDWKLSWIANTLEPRRQMLIRVRQALTSLPRPGKARPEVHRVEIKAIHRQADFALHDGTLRMSGQHLSESRTMLLADGASPGGDGRLLRLLALDYSKQGKVEQALGHADRAREDFGTAVRLLEMPDAQSDDPVDDRRTLAVSLQEQAESTLRDGDPRGAAAQLDRAIHLHEQNGEAYNEALLALACAARGEVALAEGQPEAARRHLERALRLARKSHQSNGNQYGRWVLARVLVQDAAFQFGQGQRALAEGHYAEARELGAELREGEPPSKRFTLVWLDALAGLEALGGTRSESRSELHRERCTVASEFQARDAEDVRFQFPDCPGALP